MLAVCVSDDTLYTTSSDNKLRMFELNTGRHHQHSSLLSHSLARGAAAAPHLRLTAVLMSVVAPPCLPPCLSPSGLFHLVGEAYFEAMGHPMALAVDKGEVYLGFQVPPTYLPTHP